MNAVATTEAPKSRAKKLLRQAVHKNRHVSVEGALERVFTFAFNGLVYAQIWEDPEVDLRAMQIEPHHHVVAISSGGCNVLSYLIANPAKITAVDLSPAHVALVKLKLAGLRHMPDWQTFYRFFGEANSSENFGLYRQYLRANVDIEVRRYWERRTPFGRRRLSYFRSNIYQKGMLGRFIGTGHLFARLGGSKLTDITKCRTMEEQRAFFNREISPLFEKPLVRWLAGYRASLFGLGIPPAQYEALAAGKPMADVLRGRLEKLACSFPLSENYFAWQAFNRGYAPASSGPLPPYLQKQYFETLRDRAERVSMNHASLTDTLRAMPAGSAHRFVLLDAQDWMNDEQLNELWQAIHHAAAPGARVIFRTAGEQSILPGRLHNTILDKWQYLDATSAELGHQDRSSIYGGFHVYQHVG